ncbi:GNAT family N-acetyltransferase [Tropicimonas isoalkanivorans]|uniref:Acetyltransferase (GNAT) family protein n=1 Tax=Tropicimonas isoalkanivorans TaxID=441112 RepID=A0A1I1DYC0_9RHOB|nr:GNAT family N-acetyltransferase [Tropicimonas isoalkanivorans]SFB79901.1 Acetyltransferase (GNAT) family protein [Tropicimonas isoalkanivorans]
MESPIIRRAIPSDAAAFTAAIRAAYGPWIDRLDGLPDVDAGVAEEIAQHPVWVAESRRSGRILGGLVLHLGSDTAKVANLAVCPDCGGRGIGRALMAAAEAHAHDKGYRRMTLSSHGDMTPTLRFYRKSGWAETGREGYRVFMEKAIG